MSKKNTRSISSHLNASQRDVIEELTDKSKRTITSILYIINLFSAGISSIPIVPYAKLAKRAYNLPIESINLTSSIYSATTLFGATFGSFYFAKYGCRKAALISNFLLVFGGILRIIGTNGNFGLINISMAISGIGNAFSTSGIGHFSDHWYVGSNVKKPYYFNFLLIF